MAERVSKRVEFDASYNNHSHSTRAVAVDQAVLLDQEKGDISRKHASPMRRLGIQVNVEIDGIAQMDQIQSNPIS